MDRPQGNGAYPHDGLDNAWGFLQSRGNQILEPRRGPAGDKNVPGIATLTDNWNVWPREKSNYTVYLITQNSFSLRVFSSNSSQAISTISMPTGNYMLKRVSHNMQYTCPRPV